MCYDVIHEHINIKSVMSSPTIFSYYRSRTLQNPQLTQGFSKSTWKQLDI